MTARTLALSCVLSLLACGPTRPADESELDGGPECTDNDSGCCSLPYDAANLHHEGDGACVQHAADACACSCSKWDAPSSGYPDECCTCPSDCVPTMGCSNPFPSEPNVTVRWCCYPESA